MLSDIIEMISASGAPGVTTDKLYNVSGTLFWNGTDLTAGGGGGTEIRDTGDTTTFVNTEFSGGGGAGVPFNLKMESGPNTTGSGAGGGIAIEAGGGALYGDGGDINMNTGNGGTKGAGGDLIATAGYGDYNQDGGSIIFTAGQGGSLYSGGRGGECTMHAGNSGSGAAVNNSGGLTGLYSGDGGATDGGGGECRLYAGNGYSGGTGAGGDVKLKPGSGGVTANDGDIIFYPPGGGTNVTVRVGTGVPTHAAPNGSLFLRTDGGSGTTFYVREVAAWVAK